MREQRSRSLASALRGGSEGVPVRLRITVGDRTVEHRCVATVSGGTFGLTLEVRGGVMADCRVDGLDGCPIADCDLSGLGLPDGELDAELIAGG